MHQCLQCTESSLFSRSYQNSNNYSTPAPAQQSASYNSGGGYGSSGYGYSTGNQGGYEQDAYG